MNKQLEMGTRAMNLYNELVAIHNATATAQQIPFTVERDFYFLAKFAGNSDTDITGTNSMETSRKEKKSFYFLANELRLVLAPNWKRGYAVLDADKLYKNLQIVTGKTATEPKPEPEFIEGTQEEFFNPESSVNVIAKTGKGKNGKK
jgi:hypothetical protein